MTDYTHLNLKDDVDDQAPNFGLAPDLESGERIAEDARRLRPTMLTVEHASERHGRA